MENIQNQAEMDRVEKERLQKAISILLAQIPIEYEKIKDKVHLKGFNKALEDMLSELKRK